MKKIALTEKQTVILIVILAMLFTLGAAVYSYTGPDRTVATQVPVCTAEIVRCEYIESKDAYRYHVVNSWSCSNESKPWLAWPSDGGDCDAGNLGTEHYQKTTTYRDGTVTYPSATVNGIYSCANPGLNGWCAGGGALQINGSEPLSGEQIVAIEGTRNGGNFACANAATCNAPLVEGTNDFTYWAVSSYGDTSRMGTNSGLKQDSIAPQINASASGVAGDNNWFLSDVSISASASDATSGLASFSCAVDDGSETTYTDSFNLSGDGAHSVTCTAIDSAGNSAPTSLAIQIDSTPPALSLDAPASFCPACAGMDIAYTVSDATSGVASWALSADGTPLASGSSGADGMFTWSDVSLSAGIHTLSLSATDLAGNETDTEADVEVMLPTATPTITPTNTSTPTSQISPTVGPTETGGPGRHSAEPSATSGANIFVVLFPPTSTFTSSPIASPSVSPTRTPKATATVRPISSVSFVTASASVPSAEDPTPTLPGAPLFDAAAIAAVAGVTAYYAQKKKEEEQAREAAEAAKRAEEEAAAEASARRRETARERNMSDNERQAQDLKESIAAVTEKENKAWKAERYAQISQTDEYKDSENKSAFMHNGLEKIKEDEAAYREKKKNEELAEAKAKGVSPEQLAEIQKIWNEQGPDAAKVAMQDILTALAQAQAEQANGFYPAGLSRSGEDPNDNVPLSPMGWGNHQYSGEQMKELCDYLKTLSGPWNDYDAGQQIGAKEFLEYYNFRELNSILPVVSNSYAMGKAQEEETLKDFVMSNPGLKALTDAGGSKIWYWYNDKAIVKPNPENGDLVPDNAIYNYLATRRSATLDYATWQDTGVIAPPAPNYYQHFDVYYPVVQQMTTLMLDPTKEWSAGELKDWGNLSMFKNKKTRMQLAGASYGEEPDQAMYVYVPTNEKGQPDYPNGFAVLNSLQENYWYSYDAKHSKNRKWK